MSYASPVTVARQCSRTACVRPAAATLTYVYADQVAVLGPLATYAEPHSYDLCDAHAERLTAPRGWEVVRLAVDAAPPQTHDDLVALAKVVREASRPAPRKAPAPAAPPPPPGSRRSHLRAVPSAPTTTD